MFNTPWRDVHCGTHCCRTMYRYHTYILSSAFTTRHLSRLLRVASALLKRPHESNFTAGQSKVFVLTWLAANGIPCFNLADQHSRILQFFSFIVCSIFTFPAFLKFLAFHCKDGKENKISTNYGISRRIAVVIDFQQIPPVWMGQTRLRTLIQAKPLSKSQKPSLKGRRSIAIRNKTNYRGKAASLTNLETWIV